MRNSSGSSPGRTALSTRTCIWRFFLMGEMRELKMFRDDIGKFEWLMPEVVPLRVDRVSAERVCALVRLRPKFYKPDFKGVPGRETNLLTVGTRAGVSSPGRALAGGVFCDPALGSEAFCRLENLGPARRLAGGLLRGGWFSEGPGGRNMFLVRGTLTLKQLASKVQLRPRMGRSTGRVRCQGRSPRPGTPSLGD